MMSFWTSVDKATKEGFKVAWFGVAVAILGRFFPEGGWLSWFGIGTTAIGLALRQREEHHEHVDPSAAHRDPLRDRRCLQQFGNLSHIGRVATNGCQPKANRLDNMEVAFGAHLPTGAVDDNVDHRG